MVNLLPRPLNSSIRGRLLCLYNLHPRAFKLFSLKTLGSLLYKQSMSVRDGLVFRCLNLLILLFTSKNSCFFPFSDLPPSSVRSGYHGVTFNQDRCHHRASSIFQPTPTGIPQRCHQKRTSKAVRICLRKHRLNCLPATDRTQVRPMLKKKT